MSKLIEILGQELLDRIKEEIPELYEALMDYIKNKKGLVTFAFCRDLLAKYNLNLEEEQRQQRIQFGRQFNSQNSQNLNDSNEVVSMDDEMANMNMTNNSEIGNAGKNQDGNKNVIPSANRT